MSEEENSNEEVNKEEDGKEEKEEGEEEEEKKEEEENKKEKEKGKKTKKNDKKEEKKIEEKKPEENATSINKENNIKKQINISKENKPIITPNTNNLFNTTNNISSPYSLPPTGVTKSSSLQIISSINSDMDSLSNTLNSKFMGVSSSPPTSLFDQNYNSFPSFSVNNYNNYYDKEDFEIKELLIKAKQLIDNTDNKIKLNSILNRNVKKYENKICQSGEPNIKHFNDNYNYTNTNYNFNTSSDLYKNNNNNISNYDINNNNNNYNYNKYRNQNNKKYKLNTNSFLENNIDNEEISDNYYKNEKQKKINNNYNNFNRNDYLDNNMNTNKTNNHYNNNDNVIFKTYQDFNHSNSKKKDDISLDYSIKNRTKKIEDLYKYTNNPRRKPMVYSQPDSAPLNSNISGRQRNYSVENSNYKNNNNGDYSISRDNIFNKKKSYLRFDNEGVNRAIDILNGKY